MLRIQSDGFYVFFLFLASEFFQEKVISVTPPVLLKVTHISYPQVQLANEISLKPIKNDLPGIPLQSSMKPSGRHTSKERRERGKCFKEI